MTNEPKLTAQQARDLAPIFKRFPLTTIDEDGSPTFVVEFTDAEADPFTAVIDCEGNINLDTEDCSYILMSPANIDEMRAASRDVCKLFSQWITTPSGKAWGEDI